MKPYIAKGFLMTQASIHYDFVLNNANLGAPFILGWIKRADSARSALSERLLLGGDWYVLFRGGLQDLADIRIKPVTRTSLGEVTQWLSKNKREVHGGNSIAVEDKDIVASYLYDYLLNKPETCHYPPTIHKRSLL